LVICACQRLASLFIMLVLVVIQLCTKYEVLGFISSRAIYRKVAEI